MSVSLGRVCPPCVLMYKMVVVVVLMVAAVVFEFPCKRQSTVARGTTWFNVN